MDVRTGRARGALAIAVWVVAGAALAQSEPPVLEAHKLDWARKPTPYEFANTYPLEAQRHSVQGRAVIVCTIGPELNLQDCGVVQETPPGHGFGDAAMSLTKLFKLKPVQADPRAAPGAKVFLPLVYALPTR